MPKMNKHAEAFRPTKNGHRRVDGYLDHLCLFNADPRTIHFAFDHWKVSEIRIYIHENVRFSLLASLHNEDAGEVVTKIAFDKICIVPPSFRDHPSSLIHHVEFKEGQHIPLARLIVLVWTIKHYSKAYACTNKNSYWLCYAIGEALKRRYDHTILRPLPRIVQQRRTLIEVINFDDLLKNYDDMWDSPIYKIDSIVNNRCRKLFIEAREAEKLAKHVVKKTRKAVADAKRRPPGFVASTALKKRNN